jgi:hypothetical protein
VKDHVPSWAHFFFKEQLEFPNFSAAFLMSKPLVRIFASELENSERAAFLKRSRNKYLLTGK